MANICLYEDSISSEFAYLLQRRLRSLTIPVVVDADPCSLLREFERDPATDSPRTPRDQNVLSLERHKYLQIARSMLVGVTRPVNAVFPNIRIVFARLVARAIERGSNREDGTVEELSPKK